MTTDTTRRLINLFDALADAPDIGGASLQLHDSGGVIIKTLKSWAAARELRVTCQRNCIGERAWDSFAVDFTPGRYITVHGESEYEASSVDIERGHRADVVTGDGVMSEQILTHRGKDPNEGRYQLCKCSLCGIVERCTPSSDFYVVGPDRDDDEGKPLVCESCFWSWCSNRRNAS